jgi:hypothetical protein
LAGFRKLLYGKGHPLQDTVVESLRLLGFEADTVRLDNVDRDVVMKCAEGRAIAEVEGKDESAIDLTKFNQLVRVWTEDFATGTEHAHPVLVGNAHRLLPPEERGEPFTEKVVQAAKRLRAGLLTTTDLFKAVVHVLNHPQDEEFKRKSRLAILNADGTLVSFPSLGDEAGDEGRKRQDG